MKLLNQILIIGIFINISFANAQEKPTSQIKVAARYTTQGVELRFFPDRKNILDVGLQYGFILERAKGNSKKFIEITRTKPFSEEEWAITMQRAKTEEEKIQLEMSQDFYISSKEKSGGNLDFTKGIANLKQQKSNEDFQFMVSILTALKNADAAKGLGLSYIDTTIQPGKKYTYRVKLVGNSPVYKIESVPVTIQATKDESAYKNKVYIKTGDTQLGFVWEDSPYLSGVDVERKINGVYKKLNDAPIYTVRGKNYKGVKRNGFSEDSLVNYQKYTYRFYAQTIFGERVKFAEVTGMPRDLTPPQKPFLKQPKHIKPNEVLIEWEMKAPIAKDFKGFAISRSDKNDGYFSLINDKLLPSTARKFIDKSFIKGKSNYYLIQALDTANNVSSSFPISVTLIDSIPPVKPVFIDGKIDSTGVVTINIQKNKEPDLMGYRLFRSNSEKHEFSVIQEGFDGNDSIPKPVQLVFKDTVTLNSLTPYIYYRIKALDQNFNQSKFSDILKVKRPDKIAPTTPVFKNVKVRKDAVELFFALSESKDVVAQYLYRRLSYDAPWELLATLKNDQRTYLDKKLEQGTKYFYSLRAKDDSDNYSKYAVPVYGKPYDDGVRPIVIELKISSDKNKVNLVWEYPKEFKDAYFVVYKKDKKGNLKQYKNVQEKNFEEKVKKGTVDYAVKAFTKDGGQSKISETKTARID